MTTIARTTASSPSLIAAQRAACVQIAAQLRAMESLWAGTNLEGLVARREAEARLVERAMPA